MKYISNIREAFVSRTLPTALAVLRDLDTPISLSVHLLIQDGSNEAWDQIYSKTISPTDYLAEDYDKFARDYTATKLLSKSPNFLNRNLKVKALDAFQEAEYQCWLCNRSFLDGSIDYLLRDADLPTLTTIKHSVSKVLGRAPSLQSVVACGGWGPGSSFALSQREASPELKCEYENTVTLPLLRALQGIELPRWFEEKSSWFSKSPSWQLVPGNLITTVPKNGKTDRTIAIEPGLNSFVQKGIGSKIRDRLMRFGINLNDQSINQHGALLAMSDGLSTLDLKAASDSISLELCEAIIPKDWLALLMLARSPRGTFDKRNTKNKTWFEYQKISSMGNGFTFELESAIFFSVLLACGLTPKECYVYGDDLIVPRTHALRVINTLACLGFSTNKEKSFVDGLFFESCGVHVFNGVDVTPIQMKDAFHGSKDIIIFANKLRLFAHCRADYFGCQRRYLPSYRMCVGWLSPSIRTRCRGPVGSGLTLFVNQKEATFSKYNRKRGAFLFQQLVPKLRIVEAEFETLLYYRLWQMESIQMSSIYDRNEWSEILASSRSNEVKQTLWKYRTARGYSERWYTLGDWQ